MMDLVPSPPSFRVGIGYDSHRFEDDRPLILGGVSIPASRGLAGHSDADAVSHAVIDALLGAAVLDDIGAHFPPDDERWRNADSIDLLGRTRALLQDAGFGVEGVDVTVICESPRLGPFRPAMRERIASALRVDTGVVSIKAKSNEGMGWIGREEGIAVMAVALVRREAPAPPLDGR